MDEKKPKPTYWDLLKHPNWQRKRLEILERSDFACEMCDAKDDMLSIHHTYYEKGLKPWEYPSDSLHALCDKCHREAQDWMALLHRQIGRLELSEIEQLCGVVVALEASDRNRDVPFEVLSYEHARGVAIVFGTNAKFVIDQLVERTIDANTLDARLTEVSIATARLRQEAYRPVFEE